MLVVSDLDGVVHFVEVLLEADLAAISLLVNNRTRPTTKTRKRQNPAHHEPPRAPLADEAEPASLARLVRTVASVLHRAMERQALQEDVRCDSKCLRLAGDSRTTPRRLP